MGPWPFRRSNGVIVRRVIGEISQCLSRTCEPGPNKQDQEEHKEDNRDRCKNGLGTTTKKTKNNIGETEKHN